MNRNAEKFKILLGPCTAVHTGTLWTIQLFKETSIALKVKRLLNDHILLKHLSSLADDYGFIFDVNNDGIYFLSQRFSSVFPMYFKEHILMFQFISS